MGEFDAYIDPARDRPSFKSVNHGKAYRLGQRIYHASPPPLAAKPQQPTTRRLRIFAVDPSALVREGKYATIEIPYEELEPGPVGCLFAVEPEDFGRPDLPPGEPVNLDARGVLLANGLPPSDSNRQFHAQMVYGVASLVHRSFRRALGRHIPWPFPPPKDGPARLRIRPFGGVMQNASYDPNLGTLTFGYFYAHEKPADGTLPRGVVYTALSHDIVCHELTHAMLDALRANFVLQTSNDMSGFHEGFADLVALFHHFLHRDALRNAIARSRGDLRASSYLSAIGQQFGRATGSPQALRSAVDEELRYDPALPAHQMGQLLMASVFDAFCTVYQRKVDTVMRLATGGTGQLPPGALPEPLVDVLTSKAYNLASQFLTLLIRAVDYLPPVDVRLGEYLRAIVTADAALVPEDPWNYREALIDAFRLRGIYPRDVASLNEDSLLWRPAGSELPPIQALSFREIFFGGDPGTPVTVGEQIAQACELGEFVTGSAEIMGELGLVANGDPRLEGDQVSLPTVESVRTLRRVGPDGNTLFDTVAEILQVRTVRPRDGKPGFEIYGGCTLILDSMGHVRCAIVKSVIGERRLDRRLEYLESPASKQFWTLENKRYRKREGSPFFALCNQARARRSDEDDEHWSDES
jgi:hypothetical protein